MSEPVTALNGASFQGLVTVSESPRRGMITLRGDLEKLAATVTGISGTRMPDRGRFETAGDNLLAWMSPDELMLMLPAGRVPEALAELAETLSDTHHMAVEVTDARALFRLSGDEAAVRETLAKLAPVDFAPAAFPAGTFRRSRLAQIPAAFWAEAGGGCGVMCFRSVARYAFDALSAAADPGGRVGHFGES